MYNYISGGFRNKVEDCGSTGISTILSTSDGFFWVGSSLLPINGLYAPSNSTSLVIGLEACAKPRDWCLCNHTIFNFYTKGIHTICQCAVTDCAALI